MKKPPTKIILLSIYLIFIGLFSALFFYVPFKLVLSSSATIFLNINHGPWSETVWFLLIFLIKPACGFVLIFGGIFLLKLKKWVYEVAIIMCLILGLTDMILFKNIIVPILVYGLAVFIITREEMKELLSE